MVAKQASGAVEIPPKIGKKGKSFWKKRKRRECA